MPRPMLSPPPPTMHQLRKPDAAVEAPALDSPAALIRRVNEIVRDLGEHRPWIYWIDLALCMLVGHGEFLVYYRSTAHRLEVGRVFRRGVRRLSLLDVHSRTPAPARRNVSRV
ncbi:MAG: hypothetical protein QM775_21285 [Pirellulales bacterium]